MVAHRQEWLMIRKLRDTNAFSKSKQSYSQDQSSGLDTVDNHAVRTVRIGWTDRRQLEGKHAKCMLRLVTAVC